MRATQRERRLLVVKMIGGPAGRFMTTGAILAGIIFFTDLAPVHVVVAIHTTGAELNKRPLAGLVQVAGKTRRGQVGALQGESGFFMLFKAERTALEAFHRMALAAIRAGAIFYKLPFVKIGMARRAILVRQSFGHAAAGMALAAIDALVFAFQGEFGPIVVEVFPGGFSAKT